MFYSILLRSSVFLQDHFILLLTFGNLTLQRQGKVGSSFFFFYKVFKRLICCSLLKLFVFILIIINIIIRMFFIMAALLHMTTSFSNVAVVKPYHISILELEICKITIKYRPLRFAAIINDLLLLKQTLLYSYISTRHKFIIHK